MARRPVLAIFSAVALFSLLSVMFLFNWVDSPTPNLPRLSGDVETLSQGMVENEQAAPLSAPYKVKNRDPDTNGRPGVANSFGPEIGRFYPPAPTDRKKSEEYPSFAIPTSVTIPELQEFPVMPHFVSTPTSFAASVPVAHGTSYYGAGEVCNGLQLNGRRIVTWNTDSKYEETSDSLYQAHPFILAVLPDGTSYGIIFDSTFKLTLDLSSPTKISAISEPPVPFSVVIIVKSNPMDVVAALSQLTGYMPLPPKWSIGYHQSRWSYYPQNSAKNIALEFRKRNIPCDVIWFDIHYMDGYRIFTFDHKTFPTPKSLNAELHAMDFHSVWMIDPGVKAETGYFVYDQMVEGDMAVKTAAGKVYKGYVWPGDCAFPDFTMEKTRDWWAGLYKDFMAQGIDGVWNDMNEPAVFNGPGFTMPLDNQHKGFGGGDHSRFHNVYGMLMCTATRKGILAANPDKRPFVLSRANYLGGQKFGAMWTGDNQSKWPHLRLSIPMIINMGLSGQPFSGPDIGGFHDNASPELFARWMGFGALFPFARGHTHEATVAHEPWAFGSEVEETCRIAINRRYILMPYIYTLFHRASITGLPIVAPFFFLDPADAVLRAEDRGFLIGNDLAVLVNVEELGNNIDQIHLPKHDSWIEIKLESLQDKSEFVIRNLPTLMMRGGSIIPIQPVVQNNVQAMKALTLLVALDHNNLATGNLYLDEGEGFSYQDDNYLLVNYKATLVGNTFRFEYTHEGSFKHPSVPVNIQLYHANQIFTIPVPATSEKAFEYPLPL